MPWFYYSGKRPVPISIGNGEVVAVRPHTHIEIDGKSINTPEIARLKSLRHLRLTGTPKDVRSFVKSERVISDFSKVDKRFADSIVSEGSSKSLVGISSESKSTEMPDGISVEAEVVVKVDDRAKDPVKVEDGDEIDVKRTKVRRRRNRSAD